MRTTKNGHKIGRPRKYVVDDNFFSVIDTEKKAYVLGLMFADGCVMDRGYISLALKSSDESLIEMVRDAMGSNNPILRHLSRYSNGFPMTEKSRMAIVSEQIILDLVRHGCVPRKSDVITFPEVPSELRRHFMRGYFDGDGTVFKASTGTISFGIISTREFCEAYAGHLPLTKQLKLYKEARSQKNVWEIKAAGKQLGAVYDFLYSGATIWLERKKNVFREWFDREPSETIIRTPEMVMV